MKMKYVVSIILLLLLMIAALNETYISNQWGILKYKWGIDYPVIYFDKQSDENNIIDVKDNEFQQVDVKMTDVVYWPKLHQLHFGIWFSKRDYEKQFNEKIYIELTDDQGEIYEEAWVSSSTTMFDIFQRWSVKNINLTNVKELYLSIHMEDSSSNQIELDRKLIYSNDIIMKRE